MAGKVTLFVLGVLVPVMLAYAAAGHLPGTTWPVIALGATAFSLMSLNLILGARLPGLDAVFGGLDQIYWVHKWTGIAILTAAFLHQQIKISTDGLEVSEALSRLAVDVAEVAFIVLAVLILISFFKRVPRMPKITWEIPYAWWRWSHRLLGLVFVALAFHQAFVKAPFDGNALLSVWLNMAALAGIAAFLWSQFGFLYRRHSYRVATVDKHAAATIVDLEPVGKGVTVRPGSFAFVHFSSPGLREPHPFTVSQVRPNGGIQFSIRGLGDYTRHLRDVIAVGDTARVEGGYGRFHHHRGGAKQVWVAAGIGITPFLAWADHLKPDDAEQIVLVYCVRNEAEGVALDRLRAAADRVPGFKLKLHMSDTDGRFDAAKLVSYLPFEIGQASLWFCGPAPMRDGLIKDLKTAGKAPRSVHFERFEFR
ncbi:MAG: ferric reductase-like transmembrane domain-containing protein [Pseudotabrizicola sp.]|uniref:ferredoxin reductase family protein n=1 Tax=Pseudotabrizicola sp. TaxID=2939647 RepID=UPI00271E1A6C|nr:ferric reductase-like transmembrane domain-containing protein [Pseudotabrizicola sp.]MDO8881802.1 ferric reductase-like transmembrane domain-containing protein [Pseudotabrizicola sp.]MDP2081316.1 ferric reductase-like transmembrane domain-containing protein [Pseudotabrizicola sp.]MDZ7576065.1 ferric reductase-like transmembrane domain-containing protein [Pseudotabrizicola sp.]